MATQKVDFTRFFTELTRVADRLAHARDPVNHDPPDTFRVLFAEPSAADSWFDGLENRLRTGILVRCPEAVAMQSVNPVLIPRNHRVEKRFVTPRPAISRDSTGWLTP